MTTLPRFEGNPMRVAVTGSTGFIGLHLVPLLTAQGWDVVPIVRPLRDRPAALATPEPVEVALEDEDRLARALQGCDAVVHLAGGGFGKDRATWEANADGTRHALAACNLAGVRRFLLASTVTVTREQRGAYGESKREAERLVSVSGLDATVFRLAFVYGPGTTGVFARLVQLVGRLPVVPVIGTGRLDIAPVYVGDVVRAMVTALERPEVATGKVYALAGPPASMDDVIGAVSVRLGIHKRKVHVHRRLALALARLLSRLPNPAITRDNVLGMTQEADHDASLAASELGFAPRSLEAGLDATFGETA